MNEHRPSLHYNGGGIPLVAYTPPSPLAQKLAVGSPRRLKWVFSLTLKSDKEKDFLQMAKVAVASALEETHLDPVCLLHIPKRNQHEEWVLDVVSWLEGAGVVVVEHVPRCASILKKVFRDNIMQAHHTRSPLYSDYYGMVGTFMRFDIPQLGFIDDYVLYTDADVMFTSDISLRDFPQLPKFFLMGWESPSEEWYGNAGVTLFNVNGMRRTYDALMNATFSEESINSGLLFGEFGPLDQGALNQFYYGSSDIVSPFEINHRPYWGLQDVTQKVSLLHFHGPKPKDYLSHLLAPNSSNRLFDSIFASCDSFGDDCYRWIDLWQRYSNRISAGYHPVYSAP